jgi:hypothetical protein
MDVVTEIAPVINAERPEPRGSRSRLAARRLLRAQPVIARLDGATAPHAA